MGITATLMRVSPLDGATRKLCSCSCVVMVISAWHGTGGRDRPHPRGASGPGWKSSRAALIAGLAFIAVQAVALVAGLACIARLAVGVRRDPLFEDLDLETILFVARFHGGTSFRVRRERTPQQLLAVPPPFGVQRIPSR